MEQLKAMEYESRKESSDVLKPRNIIITVIIIIINKRSITVNTTLQYVSSMLHVSAKRNIIGHYYTNIRKIHAFAMCIGGQ